MKIQKKSIILSVLIFLGMLSLGIFTKNDFKTSCVAGAALAGTFLAYSAFMQFITYYSSREPKKERIMKTEKEEIIHDITYDDFNQGIDMILNEESEDSNTNPYQNFWGASALLGFATTILTGFNSIENIDSFRFWIKVFIIGAALTAGIQLALKHSRTREYEKLKNITTATYFKLKKIQEESRLNTDKNYLEIKDEKRMDEFLYEVTKWAIEVNGVSIAAIQRHFGLDSYKAGKIINQMYSLGICAPSKGNPKHHIILIDMESLEKLKEKISNQ